MNKVKALILTGYGLNCDNETVYTFELAGAQASRIHINSLINGEVQLENFQIMVFGGGFSWGDDHGAGVVQSVRLKTNLGNKITKFVEKGNLVLGICNGFQTLVNMGLLPRFENNNNCEIRMTALTFNNCGNFRDEWVTLKVNSQSVCVFTKGFEQIELPIRHGEGKFYAADLVIERLIKNNQVALQYATSDGKPANGAFPYNPNGSLCDIAGICDSTGRIFGLMPHPEAFNHWTNHPDWTLKKDKMKRLGKKIDIEPIGVRMFKNAVKFIQGYAKV